MTSSRKPGPKPTPRLQLHPAFGAHLRRLSYETLAVLGGYRTAQMCSLDARHGVPITADKIVRWTRIAAVLRYDGPIFVDTIPPSTDAPGAEAVTS